MRSCLDPTYILVQLFRVKSYVLLEQKILFVPTEISPKTYNFYYCQMLFQSQIVMTQINQNTKMILKCVIHREMVKKIGGRRWFSVVATFFTVPRCSGLLRFDLYQMRTLELFYDSCYTKVLKPTESPLPLFVI